MEIIKHILIKCFPLFWVQNYPTSRKIDTIANDLMDNWKIKRVDLFEIVFEKDGKTIGLWTENFPYASGSISRIGDKRTYDMDDIKTYLPFIQTRMKLEKLSKNLQKNKKTKIDKMIEEYINDAD